MKKVVKFPGGLPVQFIADTPLPDGYEHHQIVLRKSILNARMACRANDAVRRRMLKAALRGLVEEAFEDAAANLTDRLYDLATEPDDDEDETGVLDDTDCAALH